MAFCNQCGSELPDGARFCGACGAAVAGAAPASPAPDQEARPVQSFSQPAPTASPSARPSGGGLGWTLPALVAVAAIAIAYLMFAPRPTTTTTGTRQAETGTEATATRAADEGGTGNRRAVDEAADAATVASATVRGAGTTVSAAVLDSAFNSDPAGAAERYAGPIRVSGIIATMVQPGPTPALSLEGRTRFNYMIVNFPAGYRERLAPLSKGQSISVACNEVRSLGGTTILSGCLLT